MTNGGRKVPEPSELIFTPRSAWAPVLLAAGLAGLVLGLFEGWPYAVVGTIVVLVSLRAWIREVGDDLERLPRRQRLTSAVLPAVPLRRPSDD